MTATQTGSVENSLNLNLKNTNLATPTRVERHKKTLDYKPQAHNTIKIKLKNKE